MTTCDDLRPALWLERDVRVVVCAEHGSGYTQAGLDRHLVEAHHVKPAGRGRIHEYIRQEGGIAGDMASVSRPHDGAGGTHHRAVCARRLRLHVHRKWLVCIGHRIGVCACKRMQLLQALMGLRLADSSR